MANSINRDKNQGISSEAAAITLLNLAVAQIKQSLLDGDVAIDDLSSSFQSLATHFGVLSSIIEKMDDSDEKASLEVPCIKSNNDMSQAIVAFQFYDQLTQRLTHVEHTLAVLSEQMGRPDRFNDALAWQRVYALIRENYTIETEHCLFDAILAGKSPDEALQILGALPKAEEVSENKENLKEQGVELF